MDILVGVRNGLLQPFKILICPASLNLWHPGNPVQPPAHLQHIPVDTASAVAVAVREQQLPVQIFVSVLVPNPLNTEGLDYAVVGIIPGA
ncbi:hypothetical protein D3C73_1108560 [compost metagenome]